MPEPTMNFLGAKHSKIGLIIICGLSLLLSVLGFSKMPSAITALVCRSYPFRLKKYTLRNYQYLSTSAVIELNISETQRHSDSHFMKLAIRHAQFAFREKEVPIGAVIVDSNGIVIACGHNKIEARKDPTAHAEIECLRAASDYVKNWRLDDFTLYTTLEPCPMCMGAIQQARIKKVVFGTPDIRLGALGSWIDMVGANHPFHRVEYEGGLLQEECSSLMRKFFLLRRREEAYAKSTLIDRGFDFNAVTDAE